MHRNKELIVEQYNKVVKRYPSLALAEEAHAAWSIKGLLHFDASYNNKPIEDKFEILLYIPKTYPKEPPRAMEVGGRIPSTFHHYTNDTLCLGTPHEISMKFMKNSTLLGFIEEQLIPYLYSFTYQANHEGKMPFSERKHGGPGIIEYYENLLNVKSDIVILGFLRILADDIYKGHLNCPCGSGLILRECHGGTLIEVLSIQNKDVFLREYKHVYEYLMKYGVELPKSVLSKRFLSLNKKKMKTMDNTNSKR